MKTHDNYAALHIAESNRLKVKILFSRCIKVTSICLLILFYCLPGGTSFGEKQIARVLVISIAKIIAQQKPVTLTASIKNKLDGIITGTITWNVSLEIEHRKMTL